MRYTAILVQHQILLLVLISHPSFELTIRRISYSWICVVIALGHLSPNEQYIIAALVALDYLWWLTWEGIRSRLRMGGAAITHWLLRTVEVVAKMTFTSRMPKTLRSLVQHRLDIDLMWKCQIDVGSEALCYFCLYALPVAIMEPVQWVRLQYKYTSQ